MLHCCSVVAMYGCRVVLVVLMSCFGFVALLHCVVVLLRCCLVVLLHCVVDIVL